MNDLSQFLDAVKTKGLSVTLHPEKSKKPYRCPVCAGAGNVLRALYEPTPATSAAGPLTSCRTCSGTGVLWG